MLQAHAAARHRICDESSASGAVPSSITYVIASAGGPVGYWLATASTGPDCKETQQ